MVFKASLVLALLFWADFSLGNSLPLRDGRAEAVIQGNEHYVSLRLKKNDWYFGAGVICGGTVIAKNAILTTADCMWK